MALESDARRPQLLRDHLERAGRRPWRSRTLAVVVRHDLHREGALEALRMIGISCSIWVRVSSAALANTAARTQGVLRNGYWDARVHQQCATSTPWRSQRAYSRRCD